MNSAQNNLQFPLQSRKSTQKHFEVIPSPYMPEEVSTEKEIAASFAHELGNPLAVISGRLQMIQRLLKSNSHSVARILDMVDSALCGAERMSKIIRGMQVLHEDCASTSMDWERICVLDVLREAVAQESDNVHNHQISLSLGKADESLMVNCNKTQIEQILVNLIRNSCEAIFDFPGSWIRIDAFREGSCAAISVTDSGHGITRDLQDKIMRPFVSTKQKNHPSGLGLSISAKIAERHQGSLQLDTCASNTRFVLRLPLVGASKVTLCNFTGNVNLYA